jgi:hypothetical protein
MTRQQAKEILAVYRPGTDDEQDPIFAHALELARTDAELKLWFDEALAFDRSVKSELARIIAPAQVRDSILAQQKIIRPKVWWQRELTRVQWAAAAAIVVTAASVAIWLGNRDVSFSEFRRDIADQSWGPTPHMEVKVSTMAELRKSLDGRKLPSKFTVPPALARAGVRGYSLAHWHGREVPIICFNGERQHLHLAVVERNLFPDAPGNPETDHWQAWRTASWSRDDFSYVLTGLNTQGFVKKFRKSKHWDWEG